MDHVRQHLLLMLIALAPACALDETDASEVTGVEVSELTGTANPVDCGFEPAGRARPGLVHVHVDVGDEVGPGPAALEDRGLLRSDRRDPVRRRVHAR